MHFESRVLSLSCEVCIFLSTRTQSTCSDNTSLLPSRSELCFSNDPWPWSVCSRDTRLQFVVICFHTRLNMILIDTRSSVLELAGDRHAPGYSGQCQARTWARGSISELWTSVGRWSAGQRVECGAWVTSCQPSLLFFGSKRTQGDRSRKRDDHRPGEWTKGARRRRRSH